MKRSDNKNYRSSFSGWKKKYTIRVVVEYHACISLFYFYLIFFVKHQFCQARQPLKPIRPEGCIS
jgi:hypothetical protein